MEVKEEPQKVDDVEERKFQVVPFVFDPGETHLVASHWIEGTGCPTDAKIANPNATFTDVASFSPFSDPTCVTGDAEDERNDGLLLVKTGPTGNFAAAGAELKGIEEGTTVIELGYDIRKPGADGFAGPRARTAAPGRLVSTLRLQRQPCSSGVPLRRRLRRHLASAGYAFAGLSPFRTSSESPSFSTKARTLALTISVRPCSTTSTSTRFSSARGQKSAEKTTADE